MKKWPKDDGTVSFTELTLPIIQAIKSAYCLQRRNISDDVTWEGLDIGEDLKACCFSPNENLIASSLEYQLESQGRQAIEVIVGIAVQLGMEQGRRKERERSKVFNELACIYVKELKKLLDRNI